MALQGSTGDAPVRAARLWTALLCCLAVVLTLPAVASAKPGYKVRPAGSELFLFLEGKGEYEVSLEANNKQRVLLAAEEGLFTATEYSTKGRVSSKRIEADLGDLGRIDIDVRLRPRHSEREPLQRNCKGPASIYVPGTFHGTIKFSGEGDIPPFSVKRGEIGFIRRFKRVCKQRRAPKRNQKTKQKEEKPKLKLEFGLLDTSGKGDGRTVNFEVFSLGVARNPAKTFGIYEAAAYERREEVRIARSTLGFFGPEEFRMSKRGEKPLTLKVKPEEPFAGKALYKREPGSKATWTGNLSVKLPGADPIPLTGDSYDAVFCRGLDFDEIERCFYGSGSHSQPLALARLSSLR